MSTDMTLERDIPAAALKPAGRLAYIDNIRWIMIVMVVAMHACVTYSGLGSWFYHETLQQDIASSLAFAFYQTFSQSFFMGILFLIAGTLVPRGYDRKGFGRFVLDRIVRLGVPTAVFMFVLEPLIRVIMAIADGETVTLQAFGGWYARYVLSLDFVSSTGPLWFALALLIFNLVYALIRLVAGAPKPAAPRTLTHGAVVLFIALLAAASFAVRLVQPLGTSVLNMQLCYFPQYIALFIVGVRAGRTGLLGSVPYRFGAVWFKLAFAVGVPAWLLLMGFGGALSGNVDAYSGGIQWQAAAYALWEAFIGVSMSLGLLTLFRERANTANPATSWLSANCFGVYVFHAPILVVASLLIRTWAAHPLAKTGAALGTALLASYLFAALVRTIPGLKKIFS